MESIRCACGALLFKARPHAILDGIEIKCRRCGTLNHLTSRPQSPHPERPGASDDEDGRSWPGDPPTEPSTR